MKIHINNQQLKSLWIYIFPFIYLTLLAILKFLDNYLLSLIEIKTLVINLTLDLNFLSYISFFLIYLAFTYRSKILISFTSVFLMYLFITYFFTIKENLFELLIKILIIFCIYIISIQSNNLIYLETSVLLTSVLILINLINITQYSWLFIFLVPFLLSKDLESDGIILFTFLIPLYQILGNLDYFILIISLMLFLKDRNNGSDLKKTNFLIFSLIYSIFRFEEFNYYIRTNPDTWTWLFTGIRMEIYDLETYQAMWDYKGPINGLLYQGIVKFANIFNLHLIDSLTLFFLILIFILTNYFYWHFYYVDNVPRIFLFISSTYLLLILTNEIWSELRLDPRLIGGIFITFGLITYLKKKYFISGGFLTLSIFCLISFLIPIGLIGITLLILKKINLKFFYGIFSVIAIFSYYLFSTHQFEEYIFFNFEILFAFVDWESSFTVFDMIKQFSLLFIFVVIFLFLYFKNNKKRLPNLSIILFTAYLIGEVLHIYITHARWYHYKILLVMPLVLLFHSLVNENYKTRFFNFKEFAPLFIILVLTFGPYSLIMFPNYIIPTNNYGIIKILNPSEEYLKEIYSSVEIKNSVSEFSPAIYLTHEDEDYNYYFNKHGLIGATRFPSYYWFTNESFKNTKVLNNNNISKLFLEDIKKENPKYLVKSNNFDISNIGNLTFLEEINKYDKLIYCIEKSCLYKKSN